MARHDKVAARYARAIFDFLKDETKIRAAIEELNRFAALVEGHPELNLVLTGEMFSGSARTEIVNDVAAKLKLSDSTKQILTQISNLRRIGHVKAIAERLNQLLLEAASVVPLEVQSASELSSADKTKVQTKFEKLFGKKVEASFLVDPNLIGGVRVSASGKTYDGSVSGWLGELSEQLVGGKF